MDTLLRYMRCLLAFLIGASGWSGTFGNGFLQERAECAFPQPCFAWVRWEACNMGSTLQTNYYTIIDECTTDNRNTWLRATKRFEYQFDLIQEDGDGEAEPGGVVAVSRCTKKTINIPASSDDAVSILRSPGMNPGACLPVRVTFWFRLSHEPTFPAIPQQEYNLKVFVEDRGQSFPNKVLWGNQSDYSCVVPTEWHYADAVFGRDANEQFYISFFAYHNDNCVANLKTIAVDNIVIEQAVPSAVCSTTTAGITSSTVATTTSTDSTSATRSRTTEPTTATDPVTTADSTVATNSTATERTAITARTLTANATSTISTVPSVTSTDNTGMTLPSETTQSMPFFTSTIHTLPTTESAQARLSKALKNAIEFEAYPDNQTYIAQAPNNVLAAVENLMHNTTSAISFANIQNLANFLQQYTEMEVPPELLQDWKNRTTTVLAIAGEILRADQAGILIPPSSPGDGYHVASAIYQSLENLFNNLPSAEDAYVFSTSFSVSYVHVLLINSSSKFEDFKLQTNLQVHSFKQGVLLPGHHNAISGFLVRMEFSQTALRKSFEELQRNSNENTRFTFSLSAMPLFEFASYSPSSSSLERPSPLVMLASVGQAVSGQDIISIRHNVDGLFNYPFGARRTHQCTFLNYTSKQWSNEGCRLRSKTPTWNGTIVECSCDHLTPFSLLLTMCSSVLGQALPDGSPYSLDLAVITTVTAIVSVTCCLLALIITARRSWKKTVVFDEDTFARTALWVVLFGMYLFVLFQQLMDGLFS